MAVYLMGAGIENTVGSKVLNNHFGKGVIIITAEQRSEMPLDSIPNPFCQLCARAQQSHPTSDRGNGAASATTSAT